LRFVNRPEPLRPSFFLRYRGIISLFTSLFDRDVRLSPLLPPLGEKRALPSLPKMVLRISRTLPCFFFFVRFDYVVFPFFAGASRTRPFFFPLKPMPAPFCKPKRRGVFPFFGNGRFPPPPPRLLVFPSLPPVNRKGSPDGTRQQASFSLPPTLRGRLLFLY